VKGRGGYVLGRGGKKYKAVGESHTAGESEKRETLPHTSRWSMLKATKEERKG